ncbi:hypothetical protein, partial [Larkinella soli]|uniref:hypothetical protein n=1 Tax=Larkinella soli TaxID=1770527 RepID=UPI0013E3ECA4
GDTHLQWNYLDSGRNDLLRFLSIDTPWQTTGVFWKAETVRKIGYWDEKLASYQDWDYHLRAVLQDDLKYLKVSEGYDTFYRLDDSSASISKSYYSARNILSTVYLVEKFYPLLVRTSALKEDRHGFATFIFHVATMYYKYVDKEKGQSFLKNYLSGLGYSSLFVNSWCSYMMYRRDKAYPKVFRKAFDLVPVIYSSNSILKIKSTCKKAVQ